MFLIQKFRSRFVGVVLWSLFFGVISTQTALAVTYYVDGATGSDVNAGTSLGAAWATVQQAADTAVAGDTVYIRAGFYDEQITPANSGSSGSVITYQGYAGETAAIGGQRIGLDLSNRSYLVFRDLTIRDVGYNAAGNYADHWILLDNSHHITFENMNITFSGDPMEANFQGVYITGASSYIVIRDSVIEKWGRYHYSPPNTIGGDALQINNASHHVLIEDNTFGRADHASLQIANGYSNVIRNNSFYNDAEKALEVAARTNGGTYGNLIEGNTVWGSGFNVEDHGGLCMHLAAPENILRRNTFRDCGLWAFGCYVWGQIADGGDVTYSCSDNRLYNNVVAHNMIDPNGYSGSLSTWEATGVRMNDDGVGSGTVENNVFKNNIVYDNQPNNADPDPGNPGRNIQQLELNLQAQTNMPFAGSIFAGNIFFYQAADEQVLYVRGAGLDSVAYFNTNYPSNMFGNLQVDPQFVTYDPGVAADPTDGSFDFHLQDDSPAVDAGEDLTTTTATNSGTSVTVADARYFHAGYDGLIEGDEIMVGTDQVQVTAVDYDTNTLTIDQSISWSSGEAVNLVYYGNGPDIGAFESGSPSPTPSPSSSTGSSGSSSGGGSPAQSQPTRCAQAAPGSAPALFQIIRAGTQATLFFAPVTSNVTNYFISYGDHSGAEMYGTQFSQGPTTGAVSFTINHLSPLQQYFFRVRAGNDCMPGPWSNERGTDIVWPLVMPTSSAASPGVSVTPSPGASTNLSVSPPPAGRNLLPSLPPSGLPSAVPAPLPDVPEQSPVPLRSVKPAPVASTPSFVEVSTPVQQPLRCRVMNWWPAKVVGQWLGMASC